MIDQREQKEPVGGRTEAPTLLGQRDPFDHLGSLAGPSITGRPTVTGNAEHVIYHPVNFYPHGLGRTESESLPSNPGRWVSEPQAESHLALKIAHPSPRAQGQLTKEGGLLLRLNSLFDVNDHFRPVRLLGYGLTRGKMGEGLKGPYLILEYIGGQFIPVGDYLTRRKTLSELEALELTSAIAKILVKVHKEGIVHGDLEGFQGDSLNNIFWNADTKQVRIIDWANSSDLEGKFARGSSYGFDRSALGKLLFRAITGEDFEDIRRSLGRGESLRQHIYDACGEKRAHSMGKVVSFMCGLIPSLQLDPMNKEDTPRLLSDSLFGLEEAMRSLRERY